MRSEVDSFLTGERDCRFVASSSDSEVARRIIGVAGAEPLKKVRVWSSFIEGSEGENDKREVRERAIRVIWRIQLVLVSQVVRRIQLLWYQAMRKILSIFTQKYHHSKHGVHNCSINFSLTMNFIYNYIIFILYIYIILLYYYYIIIIYQIEGTF